MRAISYFIIYIALLLLVACGGGGNEESRQIITLNANNSSPTVDTELLDKLKQVFPFDETGPRAESFICAFKTQKNLPNQRFYVELDGAAMMGSFTIFYVYDTNGASVQSTTPGLFNYQNSLLTLSNRDPNFGQFTVNDLTFDSTSTRLEKQMGMISHFENEIFECSIAAHRYNDPTVEFYQHYSCPLVKTASGDEQNAIEFVHPSFPSGMNPSGSSSRQLDKTIFTATNTRRAYGIYRRVDADVYLYFPRPDSRFADGDGNVLKATIGDFGAPINASGLVFDRLNTTDVCVRDQ